MRVISQKGLDYTLDLPYEEISVEQKENEIWAGYSSTLSRSQVGKLLARYSTTEKAVKAMEMLRGKYSTIRIQEFIDRNVNQAVFEALQQFDKEKYFSAFFQFPQDNEIEESEGEQ